MIEICETWLDSWVENDELLFARFQMPFRKDSDVLGGGLLLYINENIAVIHGDDLENLRFGSTWIEIRADHRRILLGNYYRTTSISNQECILFMDNLSVTIITTTQENPDAIYMLGDMNDMCLTWDDTHIASDQGDL